MSNWIESAKRNLLPLSINKNLKDALKEWIYTGDVIDLGQACEVCQLCNHPKIRYQFEINNSNTHSYLYVGSECIKRFGLHAIDEKGRLLDRKATDKLVNKDRRKVEKEAKLKRVINSILELSMHVNDFDFEEFLTYLDEHNALTPKQLSWLIWQLEKNNIEHRKSDYKMKMRRDREKRQLVTMKKFQIEQIIPCMTTSQRKYCKDHRNDF